MKRDRDEGATLVEFAIVAPLFFLILFGVMDYSLGFKDWLSINHAAREGARVGVAAANDPRADLLILDEVRQSLTAADLDRVQWVRVADPDSGAANIYTPGGGCGWTPCPDPEHPGFGGLGWDPTGRDVSAPITGRLKVTIRFEHDWIVGIRPDAEWNASTTMRIEPQVYE